MKDHRLRIVKQDGSKSVLNDVAELLNHLLFNTSIYVYMELPRCSVVKNLPANVGDARNMGSIPGLGRSTGVGNSSILAWENT